MATPLHAVFDFLITALFNFLDLYYQGNGIASAFQTYPEAIWVAFVSLLLYCISYELEPRFTQVGRGGMRFFGSILSASMVSLLFRSRVSVVLYFLFILVANWRMLCSVIKLLWSWVHHRIVLLHFRAIHWINWRWFAMPANANRRGLLPL
ncbi:hypothetical protein Vadar_027076 [Vaccinium darrowii]|uniref:Uncharacterized protein n=1 Tax=Vaccinium darrowii TaxID=229202 RepID=A0ACB7ZFK4_9ERIC|nr:hypothetical protein Vadar_027076 [Vaccinium darrowii]